MENVNGALGFEATLDIDDFNVSADAMERHFHKVATGVEAESKEMEQSLLDFAQKGAMYIQTYLVGQGLSNVVSSIIQVRGQFQQLETAFGTLLGSEEKATELMRQMVDTAAKTPFDLKGVAEGAKQLLAYGESFSTVNDTLVRLGNIASGLSIPLNDIVYLYGTTMVQGRLYAQDVRQFTGRGIPLVKELAEMYGVTTDKINEMVSAGKIGFPDVQKVLQKLTDEGGQFYNLMEKQSTSLTGMVSNLGDAWDNMLNKIGTDNQDALGDAINSATYLVEHYQVIVDTLKAVAMGYGSVKAAIVLNTLATKGYTGIALIDNTVRQAKIALLQAEAAATGTNKAQQELMNAAQAQHVAALEAELTAEEHSNLVKQLRISTIASLLTAQQQEYLSNLGLTTSSESYEAAAMGVLTVEQREALNKLDLSSKSAIYRAALEQEVAAKQKNATVSLEAMRTEVKAAAAKVEAAKQTAVATMQSTEAARYEVYWAKQSGDATALATAQKKLEAAEENQATARKAALAAQTDFYTKKKKLEAAATTQTTAATVADTTAKTAQGAATTLLTSITTKCTAAMKALGVAIKSNPIGWLVSILGLAYTAYEMFFKKEEEVTDATGTLSNATQKATQLFNEQAAKVDALSKIIEDGNASYESRNKAIKDLKAIIPGYNAELTKEGQIVNNNTEAINRYLVALEKQIKLKAAQDELTEAYKKKRTLEQTESQQSDQYWNTRQNNTLGGYDRNGFVAKTLRFFGAEDETNQKKALESTQAQLAEVNNQIDALNKEIADTSQSMETASTATRSYNTQVADTKAKIKDLKKEIADMRSGKVSNDNLAAAISDKEKELKAAESDLSTLTGKSGKGGSTGGSTANSTNEVAQKQLEAQRKLEEARIEIMHDGYEKRKALLDLEHQKNLDAINKEEKELAEAKKKAGKGGLSSGEKSGFDERRSLENQSYDIDSTKLFDSEIEYRKKQYEAYWQWVNNVGKEVADTHFKDLIADGTSFTAWVNKQVADLEAKKAANPTEFSDGDANALNSLKIQQNAINGSKSAMDLFKESVQQAIGQAQTLAEKLQAVADLKDKLGKGEFHLNEDDTAAASYQLESKDADLQEEVNNTLLTQYKTYEEKRLSIQEQFKLLRNEAEKEGNAERMEEIAKGEQEALSALNAQMLMQTDSWKNLFSDLDSLTTTEIDKLIKEIQDKMNTADLNLNPTDLKTVLDKLDEAKKKVLDVNPFKALGNSLKQVFQKQQDGSKKTSKQIKTDWKNLSESTEACFDFVNDAIDSCDVLGDLIGDDGKATIQMLSGVATAGIAMAAAIKTAEKGSVILTAISIALQAIQWIAGLFNNDDELEEEIQDIQREVDSLSNSLDRLQDAYSHTYWVFSDEEEDAYQKRVQAVQDQIASLKQEQQLAATMWNWTKYSELTKQIKDLEYTLEKTQDTGDMFDLLELEEKNLRNQQELIRQQIELEKDKKDTDWDKIADWEEQIKDIDTQIEDLERDMMETLAGTDVQTAIDDFADALVDAYCQGEDAAEALGEKTKEVLKNAVVEALKRRYLALAINNAVEYLADAMGDNVLTDEEKEHFTSMVNQAGDAFNTALSAIGDWIKDVEDEETDPLTGAIQNLSEETGDIIAGRLNAAIINQSDQTVVLKIMAGYLQKIVESGGIVTPGNVDLGQLSGSMSKVYEAQLDQTDLMKQQLEYQAQIAANTHNSAGTLEKILNKMGNSDNSLLSQGIS